MSCFATRDKLGRIKAQSSSHNLICLWQQQIQEITMWLFYIEAENKKIDNILAHALSFKIFLILNFSTRA